MSKIEVDQVVIKQNKFNSRILGDTVTVTGNDIRSDAYKASDGGNLVSQSELQLAQEHQEILSMLHLVQL